MLNLFRDVANKKFYSAPKNAKFSIFGPRNMAMAGKKNSCFLARPENNFESKQTYFSYSPNKGFHPPEFQAKLFFTRNWVGGFYWDCLLILLLFKLHFTLYVLWRIIAKFRGTNEKAWSPDKILALIWASLINNSWLMIVNS